MMAARAAVVAALVSAAAHPADAETIRVAMKGLAFLPSAVTAHIGDTIEWVNDDFVAHTATGRNGEWNVTVPPHATGRTQPNTVGKVEYYCRYHPNMKGEIIVTAP
jgi:plastocyanin